MKIISDSILSQFTRCMAQIPLIYRDNEQIVTIRNNYEDHLKKILEATNNEQFTTDLSFDLTKDILPGYLPNQELNDSDLPVIYGQIVNNIASKKYPQWSIKKDLPDLKADEKIRIGFISGFFYDNFVWKTSLKGWINNFDRNKFELFGYYTQNKHDIVTDLARRNFVKFEQNPLEVGEWGQIISDDQLHILLFSGLEMEPKTLNLGALRLAPIQIATSINPEILGLSTIDYYLSSDFLEPEDEQEYYTDKSVLLPNLGAYYNPSNIQYKPKNKEEIGIKKDEILVGCYQSLSKYLPEYDNIFPRIVREVNNSKFVFLVSHLGDRVTNIFRKRLKAAFAKFDLDYQEYCIILANLSQEDFVGLLSITDIFLDAIGWSAYNSTLEAINFNIPLITFPGKSMRSCRTTAILQIMGIEDTIASSKDEYIKIAARLAQDREYRTNIAQKIATNKFKLYDDLEPVKSLENFLLDLIYEKPISIASYFHKLKNFPKAEQLYNKILQHNPEYEKVVYLLAILKQQTGDYTRAEQLLSSYLKSDSSSFLKWYSLGNIYQATKDFTRAIASYKKALAIKDNNFAVYNNLGYAWQEKGNLSEAIICYKKALQLNPSASEIDTNLANALFEQGSLSVEKEEEYALKNYNQGVTQEKEGNLEVAQVCYQKTLQLKPDFIEAQCKLGKILQTKGQREKAKEYYQKALSLNPNYGDAYYNLGTLYQDEGELENAAIFFKKGLSLINKKYAEAIEEVDKEQANHSLFPKIAQGEVKIGNYFFPNIPPLTEQDKKEAKCPFWSVVIPVYKRKEYLLECLASVLAQWEGADDMEIIVVDNGSEPPLQELVESIGKGIVSYYRHPQTIKLQENWNSALASSRGKWVHLLHDDDYVLPQFYSRLREGLEDLSNKIGAAFTSYYNVDEKRKPQWPQLYSFSKGMIPNWSLHIGISCPIIPPSIVIRRSVYQDLGGYNTEFTFTTDWELYMRIASFYDAYYEPKILVHYRRHKNTVSAELMNLGLQAKPIRYAIEMSESYLPAKHVKEISKNSRNFNFELLFGEVDNLTKNNNINVACEVLQEALKINSTPESLEKVFAWLNTEQGKPVREEIVRQLNKISFTEVEHNFNFVNP